jgi:hypothetical protein
MVNLDPFIAIFRKTGTSRFSLAIQFVGTNLPEMRLSLTMPALNSVFVWCLLTMTNALNVICSVPLGMTQLEEILMIELSSSCSVLNVFLSAPLLKGLALK